MNKIEYQDISDIIMALCVASTEIEFQLKEGIKRGSNISEKWRTEQKAKIKKGFDAVDKLRKELILSGDPLYSNKR